ncbi:hypothetical protein GUJ93_ZPchr0007g3865 [Zizania palustris]|uniref:Uncharacterized protein n=1 Tax=Zizania palustris TaxID=103762 RepID=A0A8J5TEB1_ZIZPA|nr:hypothetical protein GUJ93_ZPchr0007g3865 [Zizania palustris]
MLGKPGSVPTRCPVANSLAEFSTAYRTVAYVEELGDRAVVAGDVGAGDVGATDEEFHPAGVVGGGEEVAPVGEARVALVEDEAGSRGGGIEAN